MNIEFECICGKAILNAATIRTDLVRGEPNMIIEIEPCQECLAVAQRKAFGQGFEAGRNAKSMTASEIVALADEAKKGK